uniref:Reverse transcriptase domain-containing protein n=1 Tax=Noccaea caerulescens TaxID=107243 RepID=A0A1J3DEV8_NOCCA
MVFHPSATEISKTLFKLNPNKSHGPDGLTSGFYKAAWDILGSEVTSSIHHFFRSSFLPASTNATILTLVPKFPGASKVSDYRPVACLNTLYKVVSRLLVARLRPILSFLILPITINVQTLNSHIYALLTTSLDSVQNVLQVLHEFGGQCAEIKFLCLRTLSGGM